MRYHVRLSRDAAAYLQRLDDRTRRRMNEAIRTLQEDPSHAGTKVLKGRQGRALRVGGWRVLYRIDDDLRVVYVNRIAPRG